MRLLPALFLLVPAVAVFGCGDPEPAPPPPAPAEPEPTPEATPEPTPEPTPTPQPKAHWGYEGELGPAHWGKLDDAWALCGIGRQQSPIDLSAAESLPSEPLEHRFAPAAGIFKNTGHALQVDLRGAGGVTIDGTTYELLQFHFHTPSEHVFAEHHFPLEVHLVHRAADGRLAVLGVLYEEGEADPLLAELVRRLPAGEGAHVGLPNPVDPGLLLPDNPRRFRYPGSLTTPPCSQGVDWSVFAGRLTASPEQIAALALPVGSNARPAQPLGDRTVTVR